MKILRKYILGNVVTPFGISLLLFTLLLLLLRLVKIAEMVLVKGADPMSVVKLLVFMAIYLLNFTIPISVLICITLTFGRLSTDNELMAMKASGLSLFEILKPVFVFAAVLSAFCLFLNNSILPSVHQKIVNTFFELGKKNPISLITPGTFVNYFENHVLHINRIKDNNMQDIKIYQTMENNQTRVIIAKTGTLHPTPDQNGLVMQLENGRIDEPDTDEGNKQFMSLNFKKYQLEVNLPEKKDKDKGKQDLKGMDLKQLRTTIAQLKAKGINTAPAQMEFHTRIAISVGPVIFILAGLAFSLMTKRKEKSINFAYCVGVIVFYYVLSAAGVAASITGKVPIILCAWMANIVIGLIGAGILMFKTD